MIGEARKKGESSQCQGTILAIDTLEQTETSHNKRQP